MSDNRADEKGPALTTEKDAIEATRQEIADSNVNQLSRDAISWNSKAALRLWLIVLVQGLGSMAFAVDGSVIGGIIALPAFRAEYGVGVSGSRVAILLAVMSIGNAVVSPLQFLSDIIGRRGMFMLGNSLLLLAGVVQTASQDLPTMIAGRLLGGVGSSLSATVSPIYVSECAPAAYRGMLLGTGTLTYYVGSVVTACALLGAAYMDGQWSFRMPLILQIGPPLVVIALVYFITPESPRYLASKGKTDEARRVLAKLHTDTEDENHVLVAYELEQIERSLEIKESKPWDYSVFFESYSNRYRLMLVILYSFFQSCSGAGLISYYLPGILTMVGITTPAQQLGINLGQTVVASASVAVGSLIVDRVRRRTLLIGANSALAVFFGLMAIWGGLYANDIHQAAMGYVMLVFIFLVTITQGVMVSCIHAIYPNESLHYSLRAKGMGLYSFFQNCFGFAMTYGTGRVLAILEWKIYFVFLGINVLNAVLQWWLFPEYRKLTLEEIDAIFETPGQRPVTVSLELQKTRTTDR